MVSGLKMMNEFVIWFQLNFPKLVHDMKTSNHHLTRGDLSIHPNPEYPVNINPYHQEGDVWAHTMQVCKQAEKENMLVQIGALLHDIGKPSCRKVNVEKSKVSFYNHESMSAFLALDVMKKLELNDDQKRMIFQMIALHTEPFKQEVKFMEKILQDNYELAKNLYALNKCDHEGRFHSDDPTKKQKPQILGTFPETKSKEVVMLCGLPCSGKSTYIKENLPEHFVVSRDEIIENMFPELSYNEAWKKASQNTVDKKLQERLKLALKHDKVVIDMTNLTRKKRKKRLSQFGEDYSKKCIIFLPTLEEIKERNKQRTGKVIDERVFDRMIKTFYPPMYDDFDTIDYKF